MVIVLVLQAVEHGAQLQVAAVGGRAVGGEAGVGPDRGGAVLLVPGLLAGALLQAQLVQVAGDVVVAVRLDGERLADVRRAPCAAP
ncbi:MULTISPECIES: hypothetical protein [Actinomycetes]|uniref:hypothetical protein n=1 Tax=Actinomycetes TaxID=1760 RepID=UPI0031F8AC51